MNNENTVEYKYCELTASKQSHIIHIKRENYESLEGYPHGQLIKIKVDLFAANSGGNPWKNKQKGDLVYEAGSKIFVHHNKLTDHDYRVISHVD